MKCSALVTLALALCVAAVPAGRGGRRKNRGGNTTSSSAAAAVTSANVAAVDPSATTTAAGVTNTVTPATEDNPDPQNSLTLDASVIAVGFLNDGQSVPAAGQVASLTSPNNFINFCATVPQLPITNGKQITTGSCNPAPMGILPSTDNMPSCKFVNPKNGDVIPANQPFTIQLAISNMETGHFVNAQQNYFSAPQTTNKDGQIVGHSHVVVELLDSLTSTTPGDTRKFAFFKGLNAAAANGILTADVTSGLPAGAYKVSSINTAANHQPVLVPVAQHASVDDAVYFTVTDGGAAPATGNPFAGGASAASNAASSAVASASATPIVVKNGAVAVTSSSAAPAASAGAAGSGKTKGNKTKGNKGN